MAKILDEFPKSRVGRKDKYPWKDWFDGRVWQLTQGEDYAGIDDELCFRRMCGAAYTAAKRMGLKVRIHRSKTGLILQARKDSTYGMKMKRNLRAEEPPFCGQCDPTPEDDYPYDLEK